MNCNKIILYYFPVTEIYLCEKTGLRILNIKDEDGSCSIKMFTLLVKVNTSVK